MAQRIRIYTVINASAVLGPGAVHHFAAPDAPAGAVRTITVHGQRHRVCAEGYLVHDEVYGRIPAARFIDVYL
ncbi:hypothetical protein OHU34_43495 [Streptomyces sp. NBC_00080]|uniref:hypothetical protein n=1 Tax=Streptomyces sp. NBC_00080 TaxID=2975645 RepID=UPI0032450450